MENRVQIFWSCLYRASDTWNMCFKKVPWKLPVWLKILQEPVSSKFFCKITGITSGQ